MKYIALLIIMHCCWGAEDDQKMFMIGTRCGEAKANIEMYKYALAKIDKNTDVERFKVLAVISYSNAIAAMKDVPEYEGVKGVENIISKQKGYLVSELQRAREIYKTVDVTMVSPETMKIMLNIIE